MPLVAIQRASSRQVGGGVDGSGSGPVPGVRAVSLLGDLNAGRLLIEQLPPKAPGSRPAPSAADCSVDLTMEVTALAALLAEVVQLAGRAAMFPGQWEALAEQAMEHQSVRAALLAAQEHAP